MVNVFEKKMQLRQKFVIGTKIQLKLIGMDAMIWKKYSQPSD